MGHRVTSHRVTFCYSTVDVAVAGAVDEAQGGVTTLQMAATHPTWAPVRPSKTHQTSTDKLATTVKH